MTSYYSSVYSRCYSFEVLTFIFPLSYVVGYLIWGYFMIYGFCFIIGSIIFIIRMFIGDDFFLKFFLNFIPLITVIIAKKLINIFITKKVFLNRDSKILSLDNFRAFNVYLYFWFYYDCFMGFLNAIIRLLKATVAAVFMMPSKILNNCLI